MAEFYNPPGRQFGRDFVQRMNERYGVQPHPGKPCPRILAGRQCLATNSRGCMSVCGVSRSVLSHPAVRHPLRWSSPTGPVITYEVYPGFTDEEFAELAAECDALSLSINWDSDARAYTTDAPSGLITLRRRSGADNV